MKDFAIYTAIVGGYDSIHQPLVIDERFDYFLFSNDIQEKQIGIWQIRHIPYSNKDKTRIARWVKTHPENLLADYQASVWMDAALVINSRTIYQRIIELFNSNIHISSMWHAYRDCAFDESVEVALLGLEHENTVVNWMHFLIKEHYPEHQGLFETNVVYRIHANPQVLLLDSLWWNCIDQYSRRDQLSFNYSLWKLGIDSPFFFTPNENARNSAHIQCTTNHVDTQKTWRFVTRNKKEDRLYYYYSKAHSGRVINKRIKSLYLISAKSPSAYLTIFFLSIYYQIAYYYVCLKKGISKMIFHHEKIVQ